MSSEISTKSAISGLDQVTNILQQKIPFEVVSIVFEFLSITYLESNLGATLEQLISYSKNETFASLKEQLVNGGYKINHDGKVIQKSNLDSLRRL